MDKQEVRELHRRMDAVLHQFATENQVVYRPGNGRFDNAHVTFKVEFHFPATSTNASQPAATGNADELNKAIYLRYAAAYRCEPWWWGKTFVNRGRKFKVVNILPRRTKNCVLCERQPDGKQFIFPPDDVRLKLGGSPTPAKPFEKQAVAGGIWDLGKEREVA